MKNISLKIVFIAFFMVFALWLQSYLRGISPELALSEANRLLRISSSSAEEIKTLIKIAESEDAYRPWANWMWGVLNEKTGKLEQAENFFSKVTPDSPAYPDALLSNIFLMIKKGNIQRAKEKLALAEVFVNKTIRNDLLSKLDLAKALLIEDSSSSISALLEYRKKYTSNLAREYLYDLLKKNNYKLSPAEQLEDVNLLIKEKQYDLAKNNLNQIQANLVNDSPAKLETQLIEQELLRKTGKNALADEMLILISDKGKVGLSDLALKKIIALNWNDNKHDLALENFNRYVKRFPDSKYLAEVYYLQGRIFEEQNKNSAAKLAFEQALKIVAENNPDLKTKILRNLAWSYYRDQKYAEAASNFEKLEIQISNKDSEERDQALYWKEFSLKKDSSNGATNKNNIEDLNKLKGYYSTLAVKEFNISPKIKSLNLDLKSCGVASIDDAVLKKLDKFNYNDLIPLLRAEISWWSSVKKLPTTSEDQVNTSLLKLNLYANYKMYRDIIEQSAKSLNAIQNSNIKLATDCEQAIFLQSYPRAYLNEFKQAASNYKIPLDLILAISRTESGFDPNAVSSANALGLMQLMNETAITEGLKSEESLFDIKTNIQLGSKHMSGLIKKHNGNIAHAIAAYNAGSTAVARWIERYPNLTTEEWIEHIPYPETKNYVKKVLFAHSVYSEFPQ